MKGVLVVFVAAIAVFALASTPLAVRDAALGATNHGWDGTAHLYSETRSGGIAPSIEWRGRSVRISHGGLGGLDPARDGLLVISAERAYDAEEVEALRAFLDAGGRALVADDVGAARGLVEALDVGVRVPGVGVFTPAYSKRPGFPVAISTGRVPNLPAEVVLNHPSVVLGDGEIVLHAPGLSWLDENANGWPDVDEPVGAWPIATIVRVGSGELLVLGDPSVFTREMREVDGAAVDALLGWVAPEGRRLVVDEAHRAGADPLGIAVLLTEPVSASSAALVFGAGAAVVAAAAWRVRFRRVVPARPAASPGDSTLSPIERSVVEELEE